MSLQSDSNVSTDAYSLHQTAHVPSPITSLSLGSPGALLAGSDDGSLRMYDTATLKVQKAIRGLGQEVSSISFCGKERNDVWLACGKRAYKFSLDSEKMIMTSSDAAKALDLGKDDNDALNELALNGNQSTLAFSLDSGVVGVLDLSTHEILKMKTKHKNICGSVKFIPDRPRELVSGGYDMTLLHFDFIQGSLLSHRDLPLSGPEGGMMSPPFIMSMTISPTGILAAGTADGRLWLGFGGEKRPAAGKAAGAKKKSRKWEGLYSEGESISKVAEGPVVAMTFSAPRILTIATLLGTITQYNIARDDKENKTHLLTVWTGKTKTIEKVNALLVDDHAVTVAGLAKDAKGVIEVWRKE